MIKRIAGVTLTGLLLTAWIADGNVIEQIVGFLTRYSQQYPQQKVYLHTDKPYYVAGDTLWYKAYLLAAATNEPDTLTNVLYVELIHPESREVLSRQILNVQKGTANGAFNLLPQWRQTPVVLRAYTQWMRNFSDDLFYHQTIQVFEPENNEPALPATNLAEIADCQFLPEGGNLVNGLQNWIAFKAINAKGMSVDAEGFVLDNQDTVAFFGTQHLGVGSFNMTPVAGHQYKAFVKTTGNYQPFSFPNVQPEGFVMNIDNLSNSRVVKVYVSGVGKTPQQVSILAQQRGIPCFAAHSNLGQAKLLFQIPKDKFQSSGVVQITLFDQLGKPMCERLIFIDKADALKITLKTDKLTYKPREKVQVELSVKDDFGDPVAGDFSVSVTDGNQVVSSPKSENLLSYLLLSSDVKGFIEQPAYYFDPTNNNSRTHLDLLMMTQGWRRFAWSEVLQDSLQAPKFYPETGLSLSGRVVRPNGKSLEKPVNLTLFLTEKVPTSPQIWFGETSKLGDFKFTGLGFSDTTSILVQAVKDNGGRSVNIKIDDWNYPLVKLIKIPFNPLEINRIALDNFLKRSKESLALEQQIRASQNRMLQEVTIKAKKIEEVDTRRAVYGKADNTLVVTDLLCGGALNVLQMLQGRMAGVQVIGSGMDLSVQIRGAASLSGPVAPLFLLDGMPIDADMVSSIVPCTVEAIDVLKGASAAIYGSRGYGGVVSILTKRGNANYDTSKEEAPGITTFKRMGFAVQRQFYSPRYDVSMPNYRPDFRSTLYWNPSIKTNAEGKASFTFWNTDERTQINILLQGIADKNLLGVSRVSYTVQ